MLKSSLQDQVAAQLAPLKAAGILPASYAPMAPMHSQSQTYATGPQVNYRHFRRFTLFAHPNLGAIHETATPHPADNISKALMASFTSSGTLRDWTYLYGGGGVDLNVVDHFGVRRGQEHPGVDVT